MSFAEFPAGLGIPHSRAPRALRVLQLEVRGPTQAEEVVLGWVGQPNSSRILYPTPQPYKKNPYLLCVAPSSFQTSLDSADFPKSQGKQLESIFQPLTISHPTEWHKMGGFLAKKSSSKEKSSQQVHTAVAGQRDHPATIQGGLCCHM